MFHFFFKFKNAFVVSKNIWLLLKDFDKSIIKFPKIYVPYDSQLLIIKNLGESNECIIEEIYHTSLLSHFLLDRHFGIWTKNKGVEIYENDIYKRRLDQNGTILLGAYFVSTVCSALIKTYNLLI